MITDTQFKPNHRYVVKHNPTSQTILITIIEITEKCYCYSINADPNQIWETHRILERTVTLIEDLGEVIIKCKHRYFELKFPFTDDRTKVCIDCGYEINN